MAYKTKHNGQPDFNNLKNAKNYGKTLLSVQDRFMPYITGFKGFFKNKTRDSSPVAIDYFLGIIVAKLKNIEYISTVLDKSYSKFQHFISDSKWDYVPVLKKVALEVQDMLPKGSLRGLLIDESGWEKKGNKSAGVGHQYCGNVGKKANSQVAVFAALCAGNLSAVVDTQLYLPEDWCNDPQRCEEAGIPKTKRKFRTKLDIAFDIIDYLIKIGVYFDFISGDGFYGHSHEFAKKIAKLGLIFMLDIHNTDKIYLEEPIFVPTKGKKTDSKNFKLSTTGVSAKNYCQQLDKTQWKLLTVRDSAKGKLKAEYHFREVFVVDKDEKTSDKRILVIQRTKNSKNEFEYKYSLTNTNFDKHSQSDLAYMQSQRFFIEHSFKELKQQLGLDHFQTRKWLSWYHQATLNILVGSFLLKEKIYNLEEMPIISARDIMDFLFFRFMKNLTEDQLLQQLRERHQLRYNDIKRYYTDD